MVRAGSWQPSAADSPGLRLPLHDALASPLRMWTEVVGQLSAELFHGPQRVSLLERQREGGQVGCLYQYSPGDR